LTDVTDYSSTRIFVLRKGHLLGELEISNCYRSISPTQLGQAIAKVFDIRLLEGYSEISRNIAWADAMASLMRHFVLKEREVAGDKPCQLPADISVSVVVATRDRPDVLRECLQSLMAQDSRREMEVIVVDNNAESGLTPPVVAEFPGLILVSESRKGVSYARNAGIVASKGDIVITVDDDVTTPSDWLERLLAQFIRPDVMVVTGNVLARELETSAQQLFETYGALGRGFERLEVDGKWFRSSARHALQTWRFGGTANAAFRAKIFSHPEIGLMDEALGPGTPTGVGEDTYLFYRVLKAGYTLVYEPSAYVWHKHRRDMPGFRRQIYNYSKGHVAYHLTTLFCDHDLRVLTRLVLELPRYHFWRIKEWLLGKRTYPLSLTLLEIAGNLAGPWALWQSRRRVKREGRSDPYIPVSERPALSQKPTVNLDSSVESAASGPSWEPRSL
jgi:GT2 family glycosyltransferase